MAVTIKDDLIDGARGKLTVNGWELERVAVVTGLTGNGYQKIIDAVTATGIPAINSEHPGLTGCYLQEIIPDRAESSDTIRIRLVYRTPTVTPSTYEPQLNTIEVGGALNQIETNKDVNGNVITVQYTYPTDYPYNDELAKKSLADRTITQGGMVSLLVPEDSIHFSRLEYYNPLPISKLYKGKVNIGPWSLDPYCVAGQWLCTGIVGRSPDGGHTYTVTYSFQYRSDTWITAVTFIDPYTGKPPPDLVDGTGMKTLWNYLMIDFDGLGLA